MALRWVDGFDTPNVYAKYDEVGGGAGYVAGAGRFGGYSYFNSNISIYGAEVAGIWKWNCFPSGTNHVFAAGWWKWGGSIYHGNKFYSIFSWFDRYKNYSCGIASDEVGNIGVRFWRSSVQDYPGEPILYDLMSEVNVSADRRWHWIELEMKIDETNGVVNLFVDTQLVIAETGIKTNFATTLNNAGQIVAKTPDLTNFSIYTPNQAGNAYVDDVVAWDATGSDWNEATFPVGPLRIQTLRPNGDVETGFTTSSGTTHYTLVNEVQPDSSTHVHGVTVGTRDLYNYSELTVASSSIKAVAVNTIGFTPDAGFPHIKPLVKSGSVEVSGPDQILSAESDGQQFIVTKNPATNSVWDETSVNALQAGVEIVSV